jgi:hypothetical protein
MSVVIPLFRIIIRKRAGAGLAGECGAERRACSSKGGALKCRGSSGNAEGGGDGVRHDRTDGFHNGLAGAGGGVVHSDETIEHFVKGELFGHCRGSMVWVDGTGGKHRLGEKEPSNRRLVGRQDVGPADEPDIGLRRVVFGDLDGPAAGFMAVSPVAFPFAGDTRTGRGDQVRESGMIGKEFSSFGEGFLDVEDEKRVPAGVETAVEHNVLGGVGGEAAGAILEGALEPFEGRGQSIPPPAHRIGEPWGGG